MKPTYRIELTICRGHGSRYERTAYVGRLPRWDGAWFTERYEDAKVYVSKTWAEKWLSERPSITCGKVVET